MPLIRKGSGSYLNLDDQDEATFQPTIEEASWFTESEAQKLVLVLNIGNSKRGSGVHDVIEIVSDADALGLINNRRYTLLASAKMLDDLRETIRLRRPELADEENEDEISY